MINQFNSCILACTLMWPIKNDVLQQNLKTWRKELGKCCICYASKINNRVCGRGMCFAFAAHRQTSLPEEPVAILFKDCLASFPGQ